MTLFECEESTSAQQDQFGGVLRGEDVAVIGDEDNKDRLQSFAESFENVSSRRNRRSSKEPLKDAPSSPPVNQSHISNNNDNLSNYNTGFGNRRVVHHHHHQDQEDLRILLINYPSTLPSSAKTTTTTTTATSTSTDTFSPLTIQNGGRRRIHLAPADVSHERIRRLTTPPESSFPPSSSTPNNNNNNTTECKMRQNIQSTRKSFLFPGQKIIRSVSAVASFLFFLSIVVVVDARTINRRHQTSFPSTTTSDFVDLGSVGDGGLSRRRRNHRQHHHQQQQQNHLVGTTNNHRGNGGGGIGDSISQLQQTRSAFKELERKLNLPQALLNIAEKSGVGSHTPSAAETITYEIEPISTTTTKKPKANPSFSSPQIVEEEGRHRFSADNDYDDDDVGGLTEPRAVIAAASISRGFNNNDNNNGNGHHQHKLRHHGKHRPSSESMAQNLLRRARRPPPPSNSSPAQFHFQANMRRDSSSSSIGPSSSGGYYHGNGGGSNDPNNNNNRWNSITRGMLTLSNHCPMSKNNKERKIKCPSEDRRGYEKCIEVDELCDHKKDCPNGEDESPVNCLFYDATKRHLQGFVDALISLTDRLIQDAHNEL